MVAVNCKSFLALIVVFCGPKIGFCNAAGSLTVNVTKNGGYSSYNPNVTQIPKFDLVGSLTTVMNAFLSFNSFGFRTPKEDNCKSFIVPIAGTELQSSVVPLGHCSYCCSINDPARYVSLHFTNKLMGGRTTKISMDRKAGALRAVGYDVRLPTVIYIHGFTEHGMGVSSKAIRDVYLSRGENYNIMTMDWGRMSTFPWYSVAVNNTKLAGAVLGKFLKFYHETGELTISKIHLIGFSLGSHIAGFVGKFVMNVRKIPRITALDPAFPEVTIEDLNRRISKFDADYVDVIHTDGGVYGFPVSVGHADFYPNGGRFNQPGCEPSSLLQHNVLIQIVLCNHFYAWRFYEESVRNPYAFPATKCGIVENGLYKNCGFVVDAYMGFSANKETTLGNYFLTTNNQTPFSRSAIEQIKYAKPINLFLS